ncbi:tetratricopeptide repeat protein [bacterium]|nr:tetratricopeptide repeat protein [bacterium]
MTPIDDARGLFWVAITLLLLLPLHRSEANEIEALYVKANEHYKSGDYQAAIDEYAKITELGFESWEVYYNLANAFYKNGQTARAILNYERAKRLNPDQDDIQFNLELANLSVVDRIPLLPKFILLRWIESAAGLMSLQLLAIVMLACYGFLIGLIILRLFSKSSGLRRTSLWVITIDSVLIILFSVLFLQRVYENETLVEAIVMVEKVDVMSAPGEFGTEVFTLHSGIKVQVRDHSEDWVKIRLSDGKLGWLRSEIIQTI